MNKRIILIIIYLLTLVNLVSAKDKITIKDFSISAGETKELSITLENDVTYAAFQFDLYLPTGLTISEYSKDETRMPEGTTLSMTKQSDGSYRFLAVAMERENIIGKDGNIITIEVTADMNLASGSLTGYFKNVKLSKVEGTGNKYAEMSFPITVQEPSTVTAKSYERVYGDANPVFGFDVEGGDLDGTPTITCEATATSPVGTYDIIVKRGTETNYNVTYVKGTLTIKKAPLTISVGNYTRKKGKDNPEFVVNYDGFKNDETEEVLTMKPSATTTATKTSPTGEYPIEVSGAEAQNYEISYVNGTLTVELLPGDVNSDGELSETDRNYIVRHIMGDTPDDFDEKAANLNGDEKIDVADIVLLNQLLGENPSFLP